MTPPTRPVKLTGALSIANIRPIEGVDAKVNTISKINGQYLIGSKYSFWALDESLKPVVSAAYDPWYSANVLDLVAITPYKDDAFILMGSNKSLLRARLIPRTADDVKNWGNFTAGRTQVEHVGGLGRAASALNAPSSPTCTPPPPTAATSTPPRCPTTATRRPS